MKQRLKKNFKAKKYFKELENVHTLIHVSLECILYRFSPGSTELTVSAPSCLHRLRDLQEGIMKRGNQKTRKKQLEHVSPSLFAHPAEETNREERACSNKQLSY